ncbi:MAG: putative Zn-dependent protease, partial [Porticoccaceae bacterium]
MNHISRAVLILLSWVLASCVASPQNTGDQATTITIESKQTQLNSVEQLIKPIAIDTLYDLLVGDVALGRNQFDIALDNYSRQARLTTDHEVIALAYRIAEHVRNQSVLMEMALLWVEQSPNDPEAHRAALAAYLTQGNVQAALIHGSWLYQNHDDLDSLLLVMTADFDSPAQIDLLINSVKILPFSEKKYPYINLLTAVLEQKHGRFEQSEFDLREFLDIVPDDQRGLLLLSQLLHQQNRSAESIQSLSDALE